MIEKQINNIGQINYFITILTGTNREVIIFKDNNELEGNFIITIGKKAIILTNTQNNRREPIIVKKWNKVDKPKEGIFSLTDKYYRIFIDTDGWIWSYV
jgi:hypothetical protein